MALIYTKLTFSKGYASPGRIWFYDKTGAVIPLTVAGNIVYHGTYNNRTGLVYEQGWFDGLNGPPYGITGSSTDLIIATSIAPSKIAIQAWGNTSGGTTLDCVISYSNTLNGTYKQVASLLNIPCAGGPLTTPTLVMQFYKYLFQDAGKVWTFSSGNKTLVGDLPVTQTMFTTYGLDDPSVVNNAAFSQFNDLNPIVLSFAPDPTLIPQSFSLSGVPYNKLVLANSDIGLLSAQCINSITLTSTSAGAGILRVIVSTDSGITWKTWDAVNSIWSTIDINDILSIETKGMTATVINGRSKDNWTTLIGTVSKTIRFGYYFKVATALIDTAATNTISMNIDMRGAWEECAVKTDFRALHATPSSIQVSLLGTGDYKINY